MLFTKQPTGPIGSVVQTGQPMRPWMIGMGCPDENGRVTKLELPGNELSGSIPQELGNLDRLTVLDLTASRTMTRVSMTIGGSRSDDRPGSGSSDGTTEEELNRRMEEARQRFDNRDPVSRVIDQMAEQASDPDNTSIERNYLTGCIPSTLREHLDLEASDLNRYQGGMCISGVLKTTERTTLNLTSPLDTS